VSQPTPRVPLLSRLRPASLRIGVDEAQALIARGGLLVDVRREDDPDAGLEGAVRIAPDEIPGRVVEFPRDVPIVLACT
jgi:rhodanese-related sulfurtransferase